MAVFKEAVKLSQQELDRMSTKLFPSEAAEKYYNLVLDLRTFVYKVTLIDEPIKSATARQDSCQVWNWKVGYFSL